jgi:DNA-binding FadR family transcriptional regulator
MLSRRSRTETGKPGELPAVGGAAGIAAYLRRAILDGVYRFGERLPAERQLATALNVSRSTVREGLRMLEADKMISRRLGSGSYVRFRAETTGDEVAEITNPLELIDVRLAVEPEMTRLATLNATAKDFEALEAALLRLESSGDDANDFTKWDRRFHQLLAEASHNPLMASIYRHINHVRGHAQWSAMKDKILIPERIAEYNRQHRELYLALSLRDGEQAVRIINEHLHKARRDLLAS